MKREAIVAAAEERTVRGEITDLSLTPAMRASLGADHGLFEALWGLSEESGQRRFYATRTVETWITLSSDRVKWTKAVRATATSWLKASEVMGLRVEFDDGRVIDGEIWDGGNHGLLLQEGDDTKSYSW